jgi:mono/diheme cytochrome c family protein
LFLLLGVLLSFAEEVPPQRSPWTGHALFRDKGCISCHSVYGKGGDEGPDLGEHKFYGTYLELAASMWNHLPAMLEKMQESNTEFPDLNTEEMKQLMVYLSYMRYAGKGGNERKGRSLLQKKGCTKCHDIGGSGGDVGPDICMREEYLTPLALIESMWNHVPEMMEVFEEQGIDRPSFKGDDIANLAAGIRSYAGPTSVPIEQHYVGDPVTGRKLAKEKGCLYCHTNRDEGEELGPDFDDLDFEYSATQIAGKMWNHGPNMWEGMKEENLSFPVFEKGEMADVVAYLYSLQLQDDPGRPEKGREIVERQCKSCHTLNGEGAGFSLDLEVLREIDSPLEMITGMWNHAPDMRKAQLQQKMKWPKLKGEDMADLYAYLLTLSQSPADPGGQY